MNNSDLPQTRLIIYLTWSTCLAWLIKFQILLASNQVEKVLFIPCSVTSLGVFISYKVSLQVKWLR